MIRMFHVTTNEHWNGIKEAGFILPEKAIGSRKCVYMVKAEALEWACIHVMTRWHVKRAEIIGITLPCGYPVKSAGSRSKFGYWYTTRKVPARILTYVGTYYSAINNSPAGLCFELFGDGAFESMSIAKMFPSGIDIIPF